MNRSTVFIIISSVSKINFILRTQLISLLRKIEFKIVIISPFFNQNDFIEEFSNHDIILEPLHKSSRWKVIINNFRTEALAINDQEILSAKKIHANTVRRFITPRARKNIRRMQLLLKLVPEFLRTSLKFWAFIETIFVHNVRYRRLFKEYKPAVIVSDDPHSEFILYAVRYNIPSMLIDINIDAFHFRFFSVFRQIHKFAITSVSMMDEAKKFHNLPEKRLELTGLLRYDYLFKEFKPMPREKFFKKIGADPNKKLITFGTKIPIMYPHNADIFKILLDTIERKLYNTAQLFVRFAPQHDPMLYKNILSKIIWEQAEKETHREHIANLLYHSDVVISIGSTFCIESCLLDIPSIWIGFDGFTQYDNPEDSVKEVYKLGLFTRIQKTGAIPLTKNPEELSELVVKYLQDRSLDRDKRRKFAIQEYHNYDGKAAERIVKMIVDLAKTSSSNENH